MRALVLVGLLLATPVAVAAPAAPPPDARAHKEIGDQRRKAGDAEGALESYRTALKRFGAYAEAYEAVGEVQYGQRRYPEAIEAFGFAVEIDPGYALAWYNMAFAARKAGDLARARGAYAEYVKLRPADPDGHYGLAETLRGLGEREAAAQEYQLFVDLAKATPSQAGWVEKARGYLAELRAGPGAPPGPAAPAPAAVVGATVAAPTSAPEAPPAGGPTAPGAAAALVAATTQVTAVAAGSATDAAAAMPAAAPVPVITTPVPAASGPTPGAPPAPGRPVASAAPPTPSAPSTALQDSAPAVPVGGGPALTSAAGPSTQATPAPPALAPASALAPAQVPPLAPGPAPAPAPTMAPAPVPARPAEPPSQALIEKLGAGDRAFLAGDHRAALFLYQDATYLAPTAAAPRIRLARAYAALRYPSQAEGQLLQVLDLDPTNAEAKALLEELKNPPAHPAPAPPAAPARPGGEGAAGATGARVYKLTPEAQAPAVAAAPPPLSAPAAPVAAPVAPQAPPPGAAAAAEPAGPSAADLYRAGVAQVGRREFAQAVDSFNRALERSPDLVLAYEARASARFGLAQYREAALDYQAALSANPERASPLWGLAECYRLLGDRRAVEAYERYAESAAADVTERQRDLARKRSRELRER